MQSEKRGAGMKDAESYETICDHVHESYTNIDMTIWQTAVGYLFYDNYSVLKSQVTNYCSPTFWVVSLHILVHRWRCAFKKSLPTNVHSGII